SRYFRCSSSARTTPGARPSLEIAGFLSFGPVVTRAFVRTRDHSFWFSSISDGLSCAPGDAVGKASAASVWQVSADSAAQNRKTRRGVPRDRNSLRKLLIFLPSVVSSPSQEWNQTRYR